MSDTDDQIVLIGMRGSGKTTIGALCARRLDRTFIDLDVEALARFGEQTVAQVWARLGEPAWRKAEFEALREHIGVKQTVLAPGGGTVMIHGARDLIGSAPVWCVYLACDVAVLAARVAMGSDRPSLTGQAPEAELGAVLAQREPVYRSIAGHVVRTDERPAKQIADEIIALYSTREPKQRAT